MNVGSVAQLWRYPVKSLQGHGVESIAVTAEGATDDRRWALIDGAGKLCSAKRYSKLLEAVARPDGAIQLPDGTITRDDAVISAWLGTDVRLVERTADVAVSFEMTFDPPNDDSDYYEIAAPVGSFHDLAALHLLSTATLAHCAALRPELDWDVRRYRPNLVLDVDVDGFGEDAWSGSDVRIGGAVIHVDMPSVRCAMPLRAQSGGIQRQPALYHALDEIHGNHLGVYCSVVEPGTIAVGDPVTLLSNP